MRSQLHHLTPEELSIRLVRHLPAIQLHWLNECKELIPAAREESYPYLSDNFPEVINHLAKVLQKYDENKDFYGAMALARKHGEQRALSPNYTVKDILTEYHLLRNAIIDLASAQGVVSVRTANIVGGFIEASLAIAIEGFLDSASPLGGKNIPPQKLTKNQYRERAQ